MLPTVNILGREVAMYSVAILVGIIIGTIFAIFYFAKFYDLKREDVFYSILFGIIGLGVGAKLLYIITQIPYLIQSFQNSNIWATLSQILQGGFVFYGGLIGGVLGIYVYAKVFKVSFKKLILIIIPCVPIVHSFGRIGCLFAGCCYGMEYSGWGHIVFSNTPYAPVNVPLFPSQIIESICNLFIFLIILFTYKKFKGTFKSIGIYCILYSIVRFTLEFFRGDLIRGFLFNLSTSQWFSILLFIVGFAIFIYEHRNKKVEEECI